MRIKSKLSVLLVVLSVVGALAVASAAQAAQRYAAPAGSGPEPCAQAAPCSLKEAVSSAKAGDEVIVTAGTYEVGTTIALPNATNVQVHGDTGGPMPRIVASLPSWVMEMYEPGDSISYLEIENDADNGVGIYCLDGRLDRLRVRIVGSGGIGVNAYSDCGSFRNSLLRVEGFNSVALHAVTNGGNQKSAARNLTAIAAGSASSGVAVEYLGGPGGGLALELENSIAQGGEQDLKAVGNANGAGTIAVTHSNFDAASPVSGGKVIDGGGNQVAPPLFVDSEKGDFREAAGSPTIDAGLAGELGPLDLGGNPRALGSAPDIGAYEFVPAVVPTPAPASGGVRSIKIGPKKFKARKSGGPVGTSISKSKPPIGAEVDYTMSGPATVEFSVSHKVIGRTSGKRCKPKTTANAGHKKCTLFTPLKGRFTQAGATGENRFIFTGRIGGKTLAPGNYALTAFAGHLVSARFTITG